MIRARRGALVPTALERTAFRILGATTRDNRRRIIELAEEKSLSLDSTACSHARAELTHPRSRIAAEVAWLPGLSPARASNYCELLKHDLAKFLALAATESPLVKANLIASAIERFDPTTEASSWVAWIMALAEAAGAIDPESVLRILNEDRTVAGFPEIPSVQSVDTELNERRQAYRRTINEALDRMQTTVMIQVVADLVDVATAKGTHPAPTLIDDIVEDFDTGARPFLESEAENVKRLVEAMKGLVTEDADAVHCLVDGLERVVHNWDRVARPIHVNMRVHGREHMPSRSLAYEIRALGVDLVNIRGMLEPAHRLTSLLQEVFGGLAAVADQLQEDARALDNLAEQQREIESQNEQWAREIAYEAEIGMVFKSTLRLSTAGVQWKNTLYPLESVTRIGWGGTRNSVNFIPVGTTYRIFFGDDKSISMVELGDERIYSDFVDRLWRAVGIRLLVQLAQGLREGNAYRWGSVLLDDHGVEIPKQRLFRSNERVRETWDRIEVWSADGSFYIGVKGETNTSAGFSYQEANNVHVLEALIRAAFKQGADRLSDILETDG